MTGTPKDIDPQSELREEDEDSTLPELEPEQPAGTLAAAVWSPRDAKARARSSPPWAAAAS